MFIIDSLLIKIALIGILGVGAQWLAWRINRPAIALMLFAGIVAGPVLGLIDPEEDFGSLLDPMVKLAVAVILFEGGLSLNFRELRHAGSAVLRLVIFGVPLGWALSTAAGYYGADLPLLVAALFGGIMVVTGPTVVGPLLRSMRIGNRVRDILKWEGIVNDPIGALLAIGIFAYIQYRNEFGAEAQTATVIISVLGPSLIAAILGGLLGWVLTSLFMRGHVPEYLKAPVLLITVIGGFVGADLIMHESGLITVTIMGVVMANRPIFSSRALRRFKEDLAVLLDLRRIHPAFGDTRLGGDAEIPAAFHRLPAAAIIRCPSAHGVAQPSLFECSVAREAVYRVDRTARHCSHCDNRPVRIAAGR